MKADDIEYVCGIIAGLSGLPVRVFDGEKQTFFFICLGVAERPDEYI